MNTMRTLLARLFGGGLCLYWILFPGACFLAEQSARAGQELAGAILVPFAFPWGLMLLGAMHGPMPVWLNMFINTALVILLWHRLARLTKQ